MTTFILHIQIKEINAIVCFARVLWIVNLVEATRDFLWEISQLLFYYLHNLTSAEMTQNRLIEWLNDITTLPV